MKFNIEKENQDKSGIYIIRNTINNLIYVGSTKNINKRYKEHKNLLLNNKHQNSRIQRFVNKYGIDTLSFNLIEIVKNKENLIQREQFYLDLLQPFKKDIGFNVCIKSGAIAGIDFKIQTIEKLKELSKQRWIDDYDKMYQGCLKSAKKRKGKQIWNENMPHPNLGKPGKTKGQKRSAEFCERMRIQALTKNGMKGKKLTLQQIEERKNVL